MDAAPNPVVRSLVPFAHVASVPDSVAFYRKLGFEIRNTFVPKGESEPAWAYLESDRARLMLGTADPPVTAGLQGVLFYLYCDDGARPGPTWRKRASSPDRSRTPSTPRAASSGCTTRTGTSSWLPIPRGGGDV